MSDLLMPLRDLLEFNLACYVRECSRTKPKQATLNDLEKALKKSFMPSWHYMNSLANSGESPYLYDLLMDKISRGESAEFAIARFFLKHRFPTKSA